MRSVLPASDLCLGSPSFHKVRFFSRLTWAWHEHAPFAFWLVDALKPRRIVELGVHEGFSFFAFCQGARDAGVPAELSAVDTWGGDKHAGEYSDDIFRSVERVWRADYSDIARLMPCTFDEALGEFEDASIDLLHIDGLHTYDAVRHDFDNWLPKMRSGGVVLFHDTAERRDDFGVYRLWQEISRDRPSFEFLHGHGLGVLGIGDGFPAAVQQLFDAGRDPAHTAIIREAYGRLGAGAARDGECERLGDELAELRPLVARLAELETTLADTQVHVRNLEAEARKLRDERDAMRDERDTLRDERDAMRDERDAMRDERDTLRTERAEMGTDRDALRAERDALRGSTSWRLTAPLRTTVDQVRRLRSTVHQGHRTVQGYGGYAQVLRAAHGAARRDGYLPTVRRGVRTLGRVAATAPAAPEADLLKGRRYFAFQPQAHGDPATADRSGRYSLAPQPAGYIYVPPRRPDDLDARIAALGRKPFFSIVTPTYNTPPELLAAALGSVQAQWYPDWELVIADDASPKAETREALSAIDDPRVKVLLLEENGGISAATNAAIEAVRGDYVVFLDHDDELTPDCLWELAQAIDRDDADFVYSDEDKIDEDGRFVQPFFKPDWSPDTLMSTMYTCHVSCVRRSLLGEVGPLRPEFDGSQDWDLILRVTERAERIVHVPRVLYHWRIIPNSVASDLAAKPYAVNAGQRAREAALERRGTPGRLEPIQQVPGYFRVSYDVQGAPLVSIVVPTRNNGAVLQRCLSSLRGVNAWDRYEVVVVDNGSDDAASLRTLSELEGEEKVRVVRHDAPFNFSELNNLGVKRSQGDVLLFLNDDTEVISPNALERMIGYAQLSHVGPVGAKLIYPETGLIQHAGVINVERGPVHAFLQREADRPEYFMRNLLEYDWLAVTGACLMIERGKLEDLGGWDEAFPIAYNDIELCFRAHEAGLFSVVCQAAQFLHHESLSRGTDLSPERRKRLTADMDRLWRKHPDLLMRDPFHNPNLHPDELHFQLTDGSFV